MKWKIDYPDTDKRIVELRISSIDDTAALVSVLNTAGYFTRVQAVSGEYLVEILNPRRELKED